jgi:hypothetical protein
MPGSRSPLDAPICSSHPLSILPRGHPLPSPPRSPHAARKTLSPSASPRPPQPQLPTNANNVPASPTSPRDTAPHRVPTSPPRPTTHGQVPPSRVVHLGSSGVPQLANLPVGNPLPSPPSTPRAVR